MSNILIVAAHADDETLGCGGTIAKHCARGDYVHVVFMADGVSSRDDAKSSEVVRRENSVKKALAELGVDEYHFLDFPDNRMDQVALLDVVKPLEKIVSEVNPRIIYTHHYGDLNVDHRICHQAVMTACRPVPDSCVQEILCFEVMSSTEWATRGVMPFIPNVFVDITEQWDVKRKALEMYEMEMRPSPHSRSMRNLEALAIYRGHSCGLMMAEGFEIVRSIR